MKPCEVQSSDASLMALLYLWKSSSGFCDSSEASRFLRDYALWEFNALLWIALFSVTFLLSQRLFRLLSLWARASHIPGPPCPSSFGHTPLVSKDNLTDFLEESHEKYGSVVKVWLGPTQLLVSIKDPLLIKEMLLKAEDKLPLTGKAFRLAFGPSSLFVSSFDKVQKRRESLATELNGRLLERTNLVPLKAVECVMENVLQLTGKRNLNCQMFSQHTAFTLLGATVFGDAFLSWPKANIYEELLMMTAKDACFWASYIVTPFWKHGFWRYQQLCTKLKCLTQDIVQQCRRNYEAFCCMESIPHNETLNARTGTASGAPSLSDISTTDDYKVQELFGHLTAREEVCGNIMGVLFHGCLTTANLISNMLGRLVTHPDVQDKIYSELIMAKQNIIKEKPHNLDKMPLLLATVYESARLLSAGPLLQRCSLKHDLMLESGLVIPAGAVVVVPIHLVQLDDSSWGKDAGKFNPFRFLSTSEKASISVDVKTSSAGTVRECADHLGNSLVLNDPNENAAFLPFGSGTRACVGQKLVIQCVATLFASLLEHYEVGSDSNLKPVTKSDVTQRFPAQGIVFKKRNK